LPNAEQKEIAVIEPEVVEDEETVLFEEKFEY
jgi:hypothetical protein